MVAEIRAALVGYPHFESIFIDRVELPDGAVLKAERKTRVISFQEAQNFDVWEMSLIRYIAARELGFDAIAIPVFCARRFVQWMIQVREDSDIVDPKDLAGRRIGQHYIGNTDAVWAKGILEEGYDLDLASISWFTVQPERPSSTVLPEGVVCLDGANPDELLITGQIDAMLVNGYGHPPSPGVRRLWSDPEAAAAEWYRAWRYFPMLHVVLLKESLLSARPSLAEDLCRVFETAKQDALQKWNYGATLPVDRRAMALRSGFPGSMWGGADRGFLGRDPIPYGLEANYEALQRVLRYGFEQGALQSAHSVEELFSPIGL